LKFREFGAGNPRIIRLFLILSIVLILGGLYIRALDFGSCRALPANSTNFTCYHTFPGTDIHITPTGNAILGLGSLLLMIDLGIWLYSHENALLQDRRGIPPLPIRQLKRGSPEKPLITSSEMVGLAGFEPATPRSQSDRVSVVCSSHAELQALFVLSVRFFL
jgi:hypothetical protein